MALQRGSTSALVMYEQSALETVAPALTPGYRMALIDTDIRRTMGIVESRVLTGGRNEAMPGDGDKDVAGGYTIQPDVRGIGWHLKHAMSAPVTGAVVGGLYPHDFGVGDLPVNGLTLEKRFPDIPAYPAFYGVKHQGFSFDLSPSGLLEMRFDVIGIDEVEPIPTAPIDASPTTYAIQGFRLPALTITEGPSGGALTAVTIGTRFSLQYSNNIEGIRTLGNAGRVAGLPEGRVAVSGSMSLLFQNLTHLNAAIARQSRGLTITFPSPATPAGQSLVFKLDEFIYSITSPGIPGPGGITADFDFRAFVATGSSSLRATLTNDIASYAAIA